MSPVTVDGQPWEDYRPWENGPTHLEINTRALAPAGREAGYCLCLHPMSGVIDFTGLTCKWCDQPVTAEGGTLEARTLRTDAIKAAFPELVKQS
jgi:hypothetical protein